MAERIRPGRISLTLPRTINAKLEQLKREAEAAQGQSLTKSDVIIAILERFFDSQSSSKIR